MGLAAPTLASLLTLFSACSLARLLQTGRVLTQNPRSIMTDRTSDHASQRRFRVHRLLRFTLVVIVSGFTPLAVDAQKKTKRARANREAPTGPLDFRCDKMNLASKPYRVRCRGNIVARRDNLLVCCDRFEGIGDESGQWREFTCIDRVRAVRSDELMWSKRAHFDLETGNLTLTGEPRLRRGANVLDGETIVIETETDRARVVKPRGRLEPDAKEAAPPIAIPQGELPATCPLPATSDS